MSKQELKQRGFTIIEVVLVLAIAALIFLMVFIALPALQRNQRDTARKDELGKVVSALTTYQSNNRGSNPGSSDLTAFAKYIDGTAGNNLTAINSSGASTTVSGIQLNSSDGIVVVLNSSQTSGTGSASTGIISISTGAGCNTDGTAFAAPTSTRQAAAVVQLENGGAFYCQAT